MKILLKLLTATLCVSSIFLSLGFSQTEPGNGAGKTTSVTGCLVKGDEPKEVWLAEKSGTIYGLESSKIDLNAHLGHKVVVTGYVLPESKVEAAKEAKDQSQTGKSETADFRVLSLKVVSTACK